MTFKVEAQFDGSTWTDITGSCEDVTVRRGRSGDLDVVEAGTCSIVLRNDDGDFTPENTQGSYVSGGVSQILPGVKVRVRVAAGTTDTGYDDADVDYDSADSVYDGGALRYLFVGEADRWEPDWSADGNALVNLECVDGFEQLRRVELDYPHGQEIVANSPAAYWQFGQNSTKQPEAQGLSQYDLTTPTETGLTALATGASASMKATVSKTAALNSPPSAWVGESNDLTFSLLLQYQGGGVNAILGGVTADASLSDGCGWELRVDGAGTIFLTINNGGTSEDLIGDTLTWTTGTIYHVGFWWDQSTKTVTFYRNGSTVGSDTGTITPDATGTRGAPYLIFPNAPNDNLYVSDMALWTSDQSAIMDDLHDSVTGFASDLPGARIGRLLDWAGWPSADRNIDTGTTSLAAIDADNVLTACQDAAAADGGVFFLTRDGDARFQGRRGRWEDDTAVVATFDDDGTDTPYEQVGWRFDRVYLQNAVTVGSDTQGVSDGYAEDSTSIGVYGRRTLSISTISNDTDDNAERAVWEVSRRRNPHLRLERLSSSNLDVTEQEAAAGLELQDLVQVFRRPGSGQDDIGVDLRVGSTTHNIGGAGHRWTVDFGLLEAETDQPGVYGTAVYGVDADAGYYGY